MDIAARVNRYAAIEEHRQRPLIVYVTSTRQGVRAQMAGDVVREFIDQLDAITGGDSIDVLIHSSGGDALAAWKLMSVLRERFKKVGVLVPYAAFSAATILALGADEIIMHPHASLGPIDPQISVKLPDGSGVRQFAYEDLLAFMGFLITDMKLTDQQHVSTVVDKLFSTVDPLTVGAAKRASELSVDVGERLLSSHLTDQQRAKQIAINLNKSFFAHGDAVSRQRAVSLGLQVKAKPDPALEKLIWDAYLGLEAYMELRKPFNPLHTFLADPAGSQSMVPTAIQIPTNVPPAIVQQVLQAAGSAILQSMQLPSLEVPFSVVNALVESRRIASEIRTHGKISACRMPGGEVRVSMIESKAEWAMVPIPPVATGGTAVA